jgi:DHA1 family bicyclomycin/chloramphenicol resistance-like MFS transporter
MARHLKPGTALYTLLLGVLISLQLLGVAITLPVLPSITMEFDSTPESTQLTISAFLAGIALSQLIFGALSDRFGRKPVLLGGVTVYMLSALRCALAPDIGWLIALRTVQGMGAASGMVVVRAMVRDLFDRQQAVQMISRLGSMISVVPIIAPLFGGWLLPLTGWRGIFATLAAGSLLALAASAMLLSESIRHRDPTATDPRRLLANCWRFVTTPGCLAFVMVLFCANGAMYGYSASSAFVLMTVFDVSSAHYGWFLAITGVVMVGSSLLSERIARHWSIRKTLNAVMTMMLVSGLAVLVCTLIATRFEIRGAAGIALMIAPMLFYSFTLGIQFPNVTAAALHPVPEISGVASALAGSAQMLGAGVFVWLGGFMFDGTPATIGYGIAIGGTGAFLIYWLFGRPHAPDRH